jgi:putative 4-mercaptohistidine N1-methyltranferase
VENLYETRKLLGEYLLFHYGSADEILPEDAPSAMHEALDFAVRTTEHFGSHEVARGLDLGCAVGRSAFEMSRTCREVIGIDFSRSFIDAAESLRTGSTLPYQRLEEAHVSTDLEARLPEDFETDRLQFEAGDAMNLRADLGSFDRVHAANLLCRLPEPQRLLDRLPALVKPGGELVLATPCTWLAEFTPPENWPAGSTFDWLKERLSADFELIRQTNEPFLIRETARKFQFTFSLVTVWRRR